MFQFQLLTSEDIHEIIPLVKLINKSCTDELLFQRFEEMFMQNYECVGVLSNEKLIGCCGLWFQTRHYSGRSVEPDHVVILPEYRSQGLGKKLLDFCLKRAIDKGFDAMELNCYLENEQGQKFWEELGFVKLGYHSILRLSNKKT